MAVKEETKKKTVEMSHKLFQLFTEHKSIKNQIIYMTKAIKILFKNK